MFATYGLQHGHIEFFKRVAVVSFTQVIRVVADGMRDIDFPVYHVYQNLPGLSEFFCKHWTSASLSADKLIAPWSLQRFAASREKKLWIWVFVILSVLVNRRSLDSFLAFRMPACCNLGSVGHAPSWCDCCNIYGCNAFGVSMGVMKQNLRLLAQDSLYRVWFSIEILIY